MRTENQSQQEERKKRKVANALQKIREYYEIGLVLIAEKPLDGKKKQVYEALHPDTQGKIRRFANTERGGYDSEQLEDLLTFCEKKKYLLTFKRIERLLSIPWKQRVHLQKQMVESKWSKQELDNHITTTRPNSYWKGGPKERKLPTAEGVMPELRYMSKVWAERAHRIVAEYPTDFKKLPSTIRRNITNAIRLLKELKETIDKHLQKNHLNKREG